MKWLTSSNLSIFSFPIISIVAWIRLGSGRGRATFDRFVSVQLFLWREPKKIRLPFWWIHGSLAVRCPRDGAHWRQSYASRTIYIHILGPCINTRWTYSMQCALKHYTFWKGKERRDGRYLLNAKRKGGRSPTWHRGRADQDRLPLPFPALVPRRSLPPVAPLICRYIPKNLRFFSVYLTDRKPCAHWPKFLGCCRAICCITYSHGHAPSSARTERAGRQALNSNVPVGSNCFAFRR